MPFLRILRCAETPSLWRCFWSWPPPLRLWSPSSSPSRSTGPSPTWKKHESFRPNATVHGEFVNNCGEYAVDVNKDGKMDLISAGWMENGIFWYENPGKPGVEWK